MKLQFIYLLLGITTLALNFALTVHLFRNRKSTDCSRAPEDNDIITFRLTRRLNVEGLTTAAVPYDETLPLEEDI